MCSYHRRKTFVVVVAAIQLEKLWHEETNEPFFSHRLSGGDQENASQDWTERSSSWVSKVTEERTSSLVSKEFEESLNWMASRLADTVHCYVVCSRGIERDSS